VTVAEQVRTELQCPNCGAKVQPGEARCGLCGAAWAIEASTVPAHFAVSEEPFEISWRWFGPRRDWPRLGVTLVGVVAASVLAALLAAHAWPMAAVLWSLATAALYLGAAAVLNRTRITVEGRTLRVKHGPVPWLRVPRIEANNVARIFSARQTPTGPQSSGPRTHFSLRAELKEPRALIELVGGLDSEEEALFLQRALSRRLDLARRSD
jgi:hypothetical protein